MNANNSETKTEVERFLAHLRDHADRAFPEDEWRFDRHLVTRLAEMVEEIASLRAFGDAEGRLSALFERAGRYISGLGVEAPVDAGRRLFDSDVVTSLPDLATAHPIRLLILAAVLRHPLSGGPRNQMRSRAEWIAMKLFEYLRPHFSTKWTGGSAACGCMENAPNPADYDDIFAAKCRWVSDALYDGQIEENVIARRIRDFENTYDEDTRDFLLLDVIDDFTGAPPVGEWTPVEPSSTEGAHAPLSS